jgi:hypothetical protein
MMSWLQPAARPQSTIAPTMQHEMVLTPLVLGAAVRVAII